MRRFRCISGARRRCSPVGGVRRRSGRSGLAVAVATLLVSAGVGPASTVAGLAFDPERQQNVRTRAVAPVRLHET
jgi:hypothetical protein